MPWVTARRVGWLLVYWLVVVVVSGGGGGGGGGVWIDGRCEWVVSLEVKFRVCLFNREFSRCCGDCIRDKRKLWDSNWSTGRIDIAQGEALAEEYHDDDDDDDAIDDDDDDDDDALDDATPANQWGSTSEDRTLCVDDSGDGCGSSGRGCDGGGGDGVVVVVVVVTACSRE
ncbi:hypothetical protein M0804_009356 [Polistes exclamans]|nr:hypothetical protein M0804_009356 [Polistes exclamans]